MDEKEKMKRNLYRPLLICFFACMVFFTILSRVIDVYETAKVSIAYANQGTVMKTVDGDCSVEAGETQAISLIKELNVEKVEAMAGTAVKAGEPLFSYSAESLEDKMRRLQKEIKKMELEIEGERIGSDSFTGVTRAEAALQSLAMAEKALERQNGKKAQAEAEYNLNMEKIKEYYELRLELSEDELLNQSRNDYDQSRTDYESAKLQRDSQIREIKRKIKDTEKKIEKLEKQEEPDEDELEELRELLDRYEEDLDSEEESWDLKIDRAREEMSDKGDIFDRAGREADSAKLALKENYESAVTQEAKALESAEDARIQAEWAVESARMELQNAAKEDHAAALGAEQAKKLSALRIEAKQLDLEELKEEKEELRILMENQGMVYAPCDGTVSTVEIEAGKDIAGTERVVLSTGLLKLRGTFDREDDEILRTGDELQVRMAGSDERIQAYVEQVDLVTSQETGSFTASLPAGYGVLGEKAYFECLSSGEVYRQVIPVKALRKDVNGYYCLVLRKQKTILGEEYKAAKVEVELLAGGDTVAAVEGPLMAEEPVITDSDRVIGEGDRVRLMTELPGKGS